MTDPVAYALACLALLATPGPTNTLLATSGTASFTRSLPLIGAEFLGYSLSITTLSLLVAPLLGTSPTLSVVLRLACAAYLVFTAWHLWREGANAFASEKPVSFWRVFVATLLNPKGIIFALVLIPHLGERRFAEAAPYLAGLAGMMVVVATSWIAAGSMLGSALKPHVGAGIFRRLGASVLALFGVLLTSSVLLK